MISKAMMAAIVAGSGWMAIAASASAFDRGCSGRAVECYEKVRSPDVYGTVERPVVISPGRREFVHVPAVVEPRPYRVQLVPQRVHAEHVPAVFGTALRRQLIEPARTSYVVQPAVVERVHQTVVTDPGGTRWERSIGHDGRERLCKVQLPPVTRTVVRDVVVAPAQRVAVTQPAIYRQVAIPVLLAPPHVRHTVEPAVYAIERRPVVLRQASVTIVDHPPVIGVERQRVLVQSGTTSWQRAGDHHW